MHNAKKIMDTTTNSRVYKRAYKRYLESKGKIYCSYCPYHEYENCDKNVGSFRSWKNYRKTQWKETGISKQLS